MGLQNSITEIEDLSEPQTILNIDDILLNNQQMNNQSVQLGDGACKKANQYQQLILQGGSTSDLVGVDDLLLHSVPNT